MAQQLNIPKAVQAAALVLKANGGGSMPYISLLKLLYVMERESWKERGRPALSDRTFAMKNGPVLSGVYDLIKGNIPDQAWAETFEVVGKDIRLKHLPDTDELSPWEIMKIHEVVGRYADLTKWQLVDKLHLDLPEWQKHDPKGNGANLIPVGDILDAVGRADDAEEILCNIQARDELSKFIANIP